MFSILRVPCTILIVLLLSAMAGPALAQNTTHPKGPAVTVVNPADQPVPVTGSVEVVGSPTEPLVVQSSEPTELYNERESGLVAPGTPAAFLDFDVPDGKRLVVETVTVRALLPVGRKASFTLDYGPSHNSRHVLSVDDTGVVPEGSAQLPKQTLIGTHSIRFRTDGGPGDDEIIASVLTSTQAGDNNTNNFVDVHISGYLVDL